MTPFNSERLNLALNTATGYRRVTRCTFTRHGNSLDVEPVAASFTQDARRGLRWDGRVTIVDADLQPFRPEDLLTPYGTRVSVEVGLRMLDGDEELVPYGQYVVSSSRTRTTASGRVTDVGLIDLAERPERYRFEEPLTIISGTDVAEMVNIVVTSRTGFNPGLTPVGRTLGAPRTFGLEATDSPWSEILDVLDSFGLVAFYDRGGSIQITTEGTFDAENPSIDLTTVEDIDTDFDIRPPNVIVARGEPLDGSPPVQAVAMDDDPSSPTYAGETVGGSAYGRVTEFFSSPLLLDSNAAAAAAETILSRKLGEGFTFKLLVPYNPVLDPGDVVTPQAGQRLAVDACTVDMVGSTTIVVRSI